MGKFLGVFVIGEKCGDVLVGFMFVLVYLGVVNIVVVEFEGLRNGVMVFCMGYYVDVEMNVWDFYVILEF